MPTRVRIARIVAYLAGLSSALAFHAYALHLDETSETEPAPVAQRQA
jgi:hypothetical protein